MCSRTLLSQSSAPARAPQHFWFAPTYPQGSLPTTKEPPEKHLWQSHFLPRNVGLVPSSSALAGDTMTSYANHLGFKKEAVCGGRGLQGERLRELRAHHSQAQLLDVYKVFIFLLFERQRDRKQILPCASSLPKCPQQPRTASRQGPSGLSHPLLPPRAHTGRKQVRNSHTKWGHHNGVFIARPPFNSFFQKHCHLYVGAPLKGSCYSPGLITYKVSLRFPCPSMTPRGPCPRQGLSTFPFEPIHWVKLKKKIQIFL